MHRRPSYNPMPYFFSRKPSLVPPLSRLCTDEARLSAKTCDVVINTQQQLVDLSALRRCTTDGFWNFGKLAGLRSVPLTVFQHSKESANLPEIEFRVLFAKQRTPARRYIFLSSSRPHPPPRALSPTLVHFSAVHLERGGQTWFVNTHGGSRFIERCSRLCGVRE